MLCPHVGPFWLVVMMTIDGYGLGGAQLVCPSVNSICRSATRLFFSSHSYGAAMSVPPRPLMFIFFQSPRRYWL